MIKQYYSKKMLLKTQSGFVSTTFNASSAIQTWEVPKGINKIHVDCIASQGYSSGGSGGRIECDLTVNPGQILYIMVGPVPTSRNVASYNASDIRINGTEYSNRVIVAGGGGNGGSGNGSTDGGNGGGLTGVNAGNTGCSAGGKGGSQTAGGSGGGSINWTSQQVTGGGSGSLGMGGNGGVRSATGGAGGAGYYGGGGGAGGFTKSYGNYGAGGGGGSSYANETLCSNVVHTQGYQKGVGYITISMA